MQTFTTCVKFSFNCVSLCISLRLALRRCGPLNIVHVVADETKTVAEAIDDIVIVSRARDDNARRLEHQEYDRRALRAKDETRKYRRLVGAQRAFFCVQALHVDDLFSRRSFNFFMYTENVERCYGAMPVIYA